MSRAANVWRWVLILGPILVLALAFQSLWTLRATAAHPDADDMSVETDRVARLVDAYIARVAGVTSILAVAPEVVKLAEDGSRKGPLTQGDMNTDKNWGKSAHAQDDPFNDIKDLPVSGFFKHLTSGGGAFREVLLTDIQGRVIAASNRPENFLPKDHQKKEHPWWPDLDRAKASCRRLPLECVRITDVDSSAVVYGYDVVLPVIARDDLVVGVLKAVVDPNELEELLRFAALSRKVDVALVNATGRRLLSREQFFDEKTASKLVGLAEGSEASWPLSDSRKDGPWAFVRRLSGNLDGRWSVAVADRGTKNSGAWKAYILWSLFTLGMFVIAAGAFAVTATRGAEIPMEHKS